LNTSLTRSDPAVAAKKVAASISNMLGRFIRPGEKIDVVATVRHYADGLADRDPTFIIIACERFANGEVKRNNGFAPTVAELAEEIGRLEQRYSAGRTAPTTLPPLPVHSEESKARVAALAEEFLRGRRAPADTEPQS
jgi:hypothetical protein